MTKTSTDAQIVGSVSFINGDARQFTDSKEYLDCIREELPHEATTGWACLGGRENDFVGRAFRRGGSAKGTPPALRMRCTASGSDSFRTVVR